MQRAVYRVLKTEKGHFTEAAEDLLICLHSLGRSLFMHNKSEKEKTMKVKITQTKLVIIAVIVVAVGWVAWPAIREAAADDYLDEFLAYGVANIAPGQTARLHVVTVGIQMFSPLSW